MPVIRTRATTWHRKLLIRPSVRSNTNSHRFKHRRPTRSSSETSHIQHRFLACDISPGWPMPQVSRTSRSKASRFGGNRFVVLSHFNDRIDFPLSYRCVCHSPRRVAHDRRLRVVLSAVGAVALLQPRHPRAASPPSLATRNQQLTTGNISFGFGHLVRYNGPRQFRRTVTRSLTY